MAVWPMRLHQNGPQIMSSSLEDAHPKRQQTWQRNIPRSQGTAAEAAAFGEVIILATHNTAVFDIIELAGGPAEFAGKVVLDINNPISTDTFLTTRKDGRSLTQAIEDLLPNAHLAKAFNMATARVWRREDMTWDGRNLVVPFTASEHAASTIAALISDVNAQPLRIGGNEYAYQLEAMAAVVIKQLLTGADGLTVLNLINPNDKSI